MLLRLQVKGQTGQRGGRRQFVGPPFWGALGAMLGYFFAIFRIFWGVLTHVGFFHRFFLIFARFGGIWGRFGEDFSAIFRIFLKNCDFVQYSVLPRKNQ